MFYRIGKYNLNNLIYVVGPKIFKNDTNFKLSVPVKEIIEIKEC